MLSAHTSKISLRDTLFTKKNLDKKAFTPCSIALSDDIAKHAAWAFENIYSKPYPHSHLDVKDSKEERIIRACHGIQHVSRAAIYIPVWANLYRRYGDIKALALKSEDLKLIQIAALFHDSAREDEHEDRWDHESGTLLYFYLTDVLKVLKKTAILIAEAAINKDFDQNNSTSKKKYLRLVKEKHDTITEETESKPAKNIYQKLIHDADCLDIIRARDQFDAKYLDFYRQYAKDNHNAFDEMAQLITEARSIIETQGDGRFTYNKKIKKQFENSHAYSEIENTIAAKHFYVIPAMYAHNTLLSEPKLKQHLLNQTPYDKTKPLDEANLSAALREGKVFARSITAPSAIRKKNTHAPETLAAVEFRKMQRRLGTPTRTLKSNRAKKQGNPYRSVSLLGWGAKDFAGVGYLIVNPNISDISHISEVDANTGYGKKKNIRHTLTIDEANDKFAKLIRNIKTGGTSTGHGKNAFSHTEILYRVTDADAIYFCKEKLFGASDEYHPHALVLQAVFLQNEARRALGKDLPMFEYSSTHNFVKLIPSFTPAEIIQMWVELCKDYIQEKLQDVCPFFTAMMTYSTAVLKANSMNELLLEKVIKNSAPADSNYPPELSKQIDTAIENEKNKLVKVQTQQIIQKILTNNNASIFDADIYPYLENIMELREALRERIKTEIATVMTVESTLENLKNPTTYFYKIEQPRHYLAKDLEVGLKLYLLAKNLELKEPLAVLNELTFTAAQKSICKLESEKEVTKLWSDNNEYNHIKNLVKYINFFQHRPFFDEKIKKIISRAHREFILCCKALDLRKYVNFLEFVSTCGCLEEELALAVRFSKELGKKIQIAYSSFSNYLTILEYCDLAEICKLPNEDLVKELLSKEKEGMPNEEFLDHILLRFQEKSLLDDFNVINNIILNLNPKSYASKQVGLSSIFAFLNLLNRLHSYLPKREFSISTLPLIADKLTCLVNDFIKCVAVYEYKNKVALLSIETLNIINLDAPVTLPADLLNQLLTSLFTTIRQGISSDLSPDTISHIKIIESKIKETKSIASKPESLLCNFNFLRKNNVVVGKPIIFHGTEDDLNEIMMTCKII